MFEVKNYDPKIRLISNGADQEVLEFENYNDFLSWLMSNTDGWWNGSILYNRIVNKFKGSFKDTLTLDELKHKELTGNIPWTPYREGYGCRYIVRDGFGNEINNKKIADDYQIYRDNIYRERSKKRKFKRGNYWRDKAFHSFGFRKDPVPGTGKVRHWGHCFRKPKTTQERRKSFENTEFIRTKRQFAHLVDSWDDMPFSHGIYSQSWKKFRKTQYKQNTKKGVWVMKNAHKIIDYEPYDEAEVECVKCGYITTIDIELMMNTFNYEAKEYFVCPKCGCTDYYEGNLL